MKKGGLACVDIEVLEEGAGTLVWLLPPAAILLGAGATTLAAGLGWYMDGRLRERAEVAANR